MPRRWLLLALAVLFAGCGAGGHTLAGTVSAALCGGGYNLEHAAVTVRNASGAVIATGETGANTAQRALDDCRVPFSLHVPDTAFYQLTIGTHGAPTYSRADLAARHWTVTLSLP